MQGLVVIKPDAPFGLPMSQDQWLYFFTLVVVLVIFSVSATCCAAASGRAIMAIRDNPIAAQAMGVNIALYKTLTFGVCAGITGVAGALGAIVVQFVAPDSFTIALAISLFVGMVVGGVGSMPGVDRRRRLHHLRAEHRGGHLQGPRRRRVRRDPDPRHLPDAARRRRSRSWASSSPASSERTETVNIGRKETNDEFRKNTANHRSS